ncbi:MAG TPA: flavodoxin domain-containing protein [Geobacteraceae bacterium]
MKTVLVTYYSRTGNTKKLAELVSDGLTARGIKADLIPVDEVRIDTLPGYDGFIVGSPNYFGTIAWPVKKFIDESVKYYKQLDGKAAAAFTSEGIIGGGGTRWCSIS